MFGRKTLLALGVLLVTNGCGPGLRAAVDLRIVPGRGTPRDAAVIIDEEYIGPMYWVSANNIRLPEGEHRITIQRDGYFPWDHVVVADREPLRLEIALEPVPD